MKVGIPSEVKNNEFRVAITPAGVYEFVRAGHEVVVQAGAGAGSSITDSDYTTAGATILPTADDVWSAGDLILKVKEPIAEEYPRMRPGQVLFTYLHLAASKECTDALIDRKVTGIAYETVELPDRSLPLLAPMSEVAGRLAPQVGAYHLMRSGGGRGVLMGGVPGVYAAKVVVIGAGVSGMNAAAIALGMQGEVLVLDRNIARLRAADADYRGHLQTVASNAYEIEKAVLDADLVVVGIRPEYFNDASFVDEDKRRHGSSFTARVDVKEWLGDSQFAYIPYEAPEAIRTKLAELSRELDTEALRTQAIVSIDASSRLREGREAEFWVDARKVHVFDPESGENLTRDAEAGAELTRMADEDRQEQVAGAAGGLTGEGAAGAA